MFTVEMIIIASIFGFVYGFLLQKADFCFVASFRDWISVRDSRVGKGILVLLSTVLLGWGLMLSLGFVSLDQVWTVPIGASNLIGGFLFGVGMTIAGSCASGTLYRSGMGYIQFWIVLLSMIAGNILFAYIYEPFAIPYVFEPTTISEGVSLYGVIPLPYFIISLAMVSIIIIPTLIKFGWNGLWSGVQDSLRDLKSGNPFKKAHWDIRFVAFLLGIMATVQFVILSSISITGPETRIGGIILKSIIGEDALLSNLYFSTMFANYPLVGLGPEEFLVLFIIVGAFVSSLLSKSFKIRIPRKNRLPYAIGGGLLMGIASRIAPGCNIANLVAGVGGLSIQSVIAVTGMAMGVFVVTAYVFKMPLLLFQKNIDL